MSTPSVTILQDDNSREICRLYRHWDGHPETHGQQLANFLKKTKLVQGAGIKQAASGMEDLAVQIITHFKSKEKGVSGGYYLYPPATNLDVCYIYRVYRNGDDAYLSVSNSDGALIFDGRAENYNSKQLKGK